MRADSKWREPRYKAEIAADLLQGDKRIVSSYTLNLSMRGAFIVTDDPPALRTLLRVRFVLPPDDRPVLLHCMAAHVVPPGPDRPAATGADLPAGVGIQLYGVGGVDGTRWQHFVRWLRTERSSSLEHPIVFHKRRAQAAAPKNLDPAFDSKVKLRFRSIDELKKLYETNIERGALMLPVRGELLEGTELEIVLVHPEHQRTFALRGAVRQNVKRGDFSGVSVQLAELDRERMEELHDFVSSNISITIDFNTGSLPQYRPMRTTDAAGLETGPT